MDYDVLVSYEIYREVGGNGITFIYMLYTSTYPIRAYHHWSCVDDL
jgi:hypothetical protein